MLPGRTSSLPVASPFGISAYSVDHFAPDLQPWKQKPICWQEPRPSRGSLLIAIRPVWTSLYPIFLAPASNTLKLLLPGNPGILLVRVTPILFSALAYHGSISASVIGQSSILAPGTLPYALRILNSCSSTRSDAPAQWTVDPPTDLTIHAGKFGKSLATRQLPDVVRMSSHASCVKLSHSLLMKSWISLRAPASRITTLMPFWASSFPSVPPPAPDPTMPTTPSSFRSNFAMIRPPNRVCSKPSDFRQPIDVVETTLDVAAMLGGRALVAKFRPQLFLVVERDDEIGATLLEEVGLLDSLQQD